MIGESQNGDYMCVLGELGDYDSDEHRKGYLEDFRFVPFQNTEFEHEVEQYHQQHR